MTRFFYILGKATFYCVLLFLFLLTILGILGEYLRPPRNQPLIQGQPIHHTAASWDPPPTSERDKTFVALTLSGGGARAANFGAAAIIALKSIGRLDDVDVISGVSGGTLPAAYYLLSKNNYSKTIPFEDTEEFRSLFRRNFTTAALQGLISWRGPFLIIGGYTRTDFLTNVFNGTLFHDATFADLPAKGNPKLFINATGHELHLLSDPLRHYPAKYRQLFTFTDEDFRNSLRSELGSYPIANAVAASAAYPGLLDDVVLEAFPPSSSDNSVTHNDKRYLHLYDGGPVDNLGVMAVERYLEKITEKESEKTIWSIYPMGCFIIVIDASPYQVGTDIDVDALPKLRENAEGRNGPIDFFVNRNFLDAMNTLLQTARRTSLHNYSIQSSRAIVGYAYVGQSPCYCRVIHLGFEALWAVKELVDHELLPGGHKKSTDLADLYSRLVRIPTTWSISQQDQDDLFRAARYIVPLLDRGRIFNPSEKWRYCAKHKEKQLSELTRGIVVTDASATLRATGIPVNVEIFSPPPKKGEPPKRSWNTDINVRIVSPIRISLGRANPSDHSHKHRPLNLGRLQAEAEIVIEIEVPDSGDVFQSGPAIRNSDGLRHDAIVIQDDGTLIVGFEDVRGVSNDDYNDVLVRFTSGVKVSK